MRQNLRVLSLLVKMRYKLLWAQARTGAGKAAIFFAVYLVGVIIFALVTLGFISTGIMAANSGRTHIAVQGILGSFFISGLTVSLLMGVGPSAAFADNVLKRYPLSGRWRFIGQHLIGILDPVWLLISGSLLGLAIGLQWMGVCSIVLSVPVLAVFLVASYLCSATLMMIIRKLLQFRSGAFGLMVVGVLMMLTFVTITTTAATSDNPGDFWPIAKALIAATPARVTAVLVTGGSLLVRGMAGALLVGWVLLAGTALKLIQGIEISDNSGGNAEPDGESPYDTMAKLFPTRLRPLVAKSWRYHLRCNRVRYSLVMTAPILVFMSVMGNHAGADRGTLFLAFMFIAGFLATMVMAVNYFGWDGAGVRRYPLLPITMPEVLRAHSFASLALGFAGALGTMLVGILVTRLRITGTSFFFLMLDILAGLFFLHGLSLWIVVWAPKRAQFSTMMGNVVSLPAKILMVAAIMPLVFINSGMGPSFGALVEGWRWAAVAVVVAGVGYGISLKLVGHLLAGRRESMIETLAGAASN